MRNDKSEIYNSSPLMTILFSIIGIHIILQVAFILLQVATSCLGPIIDETACCALMVD